MYQMAVEKPSDRNIDCRNAFLSTDTIIYAKLLEISQIQISLILFQLLRFRIHALQSTLKTSGHAHAYALNLGRGCIIMV